MARGLIIAAPSSGVGKTTLTLGLIAALTQAGQRVRPFKVGPDYIDPGYLSAAAGGVPCANLDPWAMGEATLAGLVATVQDGEVALVEGVMGLHDGPGSTAALARKTGWPLLLVVDASKSAQTAAAVAEGLALRDPDLKIGGFVFNRVASARHAAKVRAGLRAGLREAVPHWFLPPSPQVTLPSRHLGLHQVQELCDVKTFLATVADWAAPLCPALELAEQSQLTGAAALTLQPPKTWPALGLTFAYPHTSVPENRIFLPGGYPELYLEAIRADPDFLPSLRQAAAAGVPIYGECGGFMVLGQAIIDAKGQRHDMAGLLPLITTFANRQRHLGYREIEVRADFALGHAGESWRGHEFHYSQVAWAGEAEPLFQARDADGVDLGPQGQRRGTVAGSYLHLIDKFA